MPFDWPAIADIAYRLKRLRRLIAVAAVLPIVVFALKGVVVALVFANPLPNLIPFAAFALALVTVHAVLFPNAMAETMTLSVAMAISVVAAPLAGDSVLGWFVLIVVAAIAGVFGQSRLLQWQMDSSKSATVLTASVQTRMDQADALAGLTPRPDRETSYERSGAANPDGAFPVFLKSNAPMLHVDMDKEMQTFLEAQAAEYDPYADDHLDLTEEDLKEYPSFWVRILEQRDDYKKISVHTGGDAPEEEVHSIVEYQVSPARSGSILTETETVDAFERGLGLGMWLSDFQTDGLVMRRDDLEGRPARSLRGQHQHSILTLLGQFFVNRQIRKQMDADADTPLQ